MKKTMAAKGWSNHFRLLSGIISETADSVEALGLEVKEFFVLNDIEECPYPAELATRLCMPKPTITVYLKSLEKNGFVKREIDSKDLRRHRLVVTPAGRKAAAQASELFSEAYGERLARLNAAEKSELQRLLEKLS